MYHSFFLEMYVTDLQTKNTSAEGEPKVINETPATALVDGNNLLGPAVGKFCMNLAIKVCWMTAWKKFCNSHETARSIFADGVVVWYSWLQT